MGKKFRPYPIDTEIGARKVIEVLTPDPPAKVTFANTKYEVEYACCGARYIVTHQALRNHWRRKLKHCPECGSRARCKQDQSERDQRILRAENLKEWRDKARKRELERQRWVTEGQDLFHATVAAQARVAPSGRMISSEWDRTPEMLRQPLKVTPLTEGD